MVVLKGHTDKKFNFDGWIYILRGYSLSLKFRNLLCLHVKHNNSFITILCLIVLFCISHCTLILLIAHISYYKPKKYRRTCNLQDLQLKHRFISCQLHSHHVNCTRILFSAQCKEWMLPGCPKMAFWMAYFFINMIYFEILKT